jgi:predicted dehydrogenase
VVFSGGNRLELHGDDGAIIGEGLFGSRPGGTFTCKGCTITCQVANPFIEEVADFVQAIQQQRQPRVTLEDGLRNVYIMEVARLQSGTARLSPTSEEKVAYAVPRQSHVSSG